jgi:hypothetical protein
MSSAGPLPRVNSFKQSIRRFDRLTTSPYRNPSRQMFYGYVLAGMTVASIGINPVDRGFMALGTIAGMKVIEHATNNTKNPNVKNSKIKGYMWRLASLLCVATTSLVATLSQDPRSTVKAWVATGIGILSLALEKGTRLAERSWLLGDINLQLDQDNSIEMLTEAVKAEKLSPLKQALLLRKLIGRIDSFVADEFSGSYEFPESHPEYKETHQGYVDFYADVAKELLPNIKPQFDGSRLSIRRWLLNRQLVKVGVETV